MKLHRATRTTHSNVTKIKCLQKHALNNSENTFSIYIYIYIYILG